MPTFHHAFTQNSKKEILAPPSAKADYITPKKDNVYSSGSDYFLKNTGIANALDPADKERAQREVLVSPCHNMKGGRAFIRPAGLTTAAHFHIILGPAFLMQIRGRPICDSDQDAGFSKS